MKKSQKNGWIVDSERIGKPLALKKKPATITKVLNFKTVILDTNFERVFSGKSNKKNYSTDELKDNSLSSLFGLAKKFTKSDRIQVEHTVMHRGIFAAKLGESLGQNLSRIRGGFYPIIFGKLPIIS